MRNTRKVDARTAGISIVDGKETRDRQSSRIGITMRRRPAFHAFQLAQGEIKHIDATRARWRRMSGSGPALA